MARNDLGRIKGTTFKPQVNKGILSFTNDNNEENPAPVKVQGVSYIPHLNDKVLSFTNDGGLENPLPVDLNTIDRNLNTRFYDWFGTQKEYDEMKLRDTETRYNLYDESTGDTSLKFFRAKHPTSYYDERITKVIQADNGKLTSWDKNNEMPIKREGNKPLNDYIVAQGDWGTIYSDGVVTVEKLAPTANEDYQLALTQLEEIQNNDMMLLNDERYTPFDFNNLADHKTLINDINNSNIKKIENTVYPLVYTDGVTGENVNIEKPMLKQGKIPTPISFGVFITKDNDIYVGQGYENYGYNITSSPYGLSKPILVNKIGNISKYTTTGTVKQYKGISYLTLITDALPTSKIISEHLNCKIRITYKGKPLKLDIRGVNTYVKKQNLTREELDGWSLISGVVSWEAKEGQSTRGLALTSNELTPDTVINENELFIEIDDSSFIYTAGSSPLPYIPQGVIVPNCNLEFTVPVNLVDNSIIVKGIEHIPSSTTTDYMWYSQKNLYRVFKKNNYSIYSNSFKESSLLPNNVYSDNFKFAYANSRPTDDRNIITFKQLLIYKGDLTQSELEAERDKFLKMNNKYNNE